MRGVAAIAVAMSFGVCDAPAARATEPFAQGDTYAVSWLGIERGVRNIGMGTTGTADVTGLSTGYFNPAGMAFSSAATLLGSYEEFGAADISLSEFVISSPIPFHAHSTAGAWHFGGSFGYARLGMEPQTERTIFLPEGTGRTFDASDWMLSATGATSWTHGVMILGAGGAARFVRSNLAEDHVNGWTFDVGAIAGFPVAVNGGLVRPRIGYAALNLDDGIVYDGRTSHISTEQRLGFGLDFETARTTFGGRSVPVASLSIDYDQVDREIRSSSEGAEGFELTAFNFAHFRYGSTDNDYTTIGFGLGWDDGRVLLRADYAHVTMLDRNTVGMLMGVRW